MQTAFFASASLREMFACPLRQLTDKGQFASASLSALLARGTVDQTRFHAVSSLSSNRIKFG
jgi:hypothetical protein